MTIDTPAIRFFAMVASTALSRGVHEIFNYARSNALPADDVSRLLTAELLYFAACVGHTAGFDESDLHNLLDEMRDEADEAAGYEARKH